MFVTIAWKSLPGQTLSRSTKSTDKKSFITLAHVVNVIKHIFSDSCVAFYLPTFGKISKKIEFYGTSVNICKL